MARGRTETKYRRRGRLGLLYKLLSLILIIGAVGGGVVLFFQVEDIQVEGNEHYSAEQIIAAAGVEQNSNLLLLSSAKLTAKVLSVLPRVDSVTVQREYPTTLRLVVKECKPAVAIATNESWWLLGANGRVLDQADAELAQQYPQAAGFSLVDPRPGQYAKASEEDSVRLESMVGLLAALDQEGVVDKIGWVDASSATQIRFAYDGRLTVEVLMNADYSLKVRALKAIVEGYVPEGTGVVDLKNDNCYFRPN